MTMASFIDAGSGLGALPADVTGQTWDLVIVGGGGAGLTAALYGSRARLTTLVIEGASTGGALMLTDDIENYPGFPDGIMGHQLTELFERQATRFGARIVSTQVEAVRREAQGGPFVLRTSGGELRARALILAVGSEHRKLGAPGEERLAGRGVSYCATCDGAFFKDKEVVVVGGGDSAVKEALFLTRYAKKIWLVHRRDSLRAEKIAQERLLAHPKIAPIWNSTVEEIGGDKLVEWVRLKDVKSGATRQLPAQGVFVFVGMQPRTALFKDLVALDPAGLIEVDRHMATSVRGIWAAGDVRAGSERQLATAVGEGCTAALQATEYLESLPRGG